jgi:formate--tetrahydrofolate ligase
MTVKSDIEIAREARMKPIMEIGKKLGIPEKDLIPYGHTKAKVSLDYIDGLAKKKDGKLILVTAINPTPAGEGKTTTTVGLGDGLNRIGRKAMRAVPWALFRHEGGRRRRRLCPNCADGGH